MEFILIFFFVLIICTVIFYYFLFIKKDIPFIGTRDSEWAIGITYLSILNSNFLFNEPDQLQNPIITAEDTGFKDAQFVADPFIFKYENNYYLFFEIMRSRKGVIGLAKRDYTHAWHFETIVLEEKFHLSYPSVFSINQRFYMLPETSQKKEIRIYSSKSFPYDWKFERILLEGKEWFDPSIIQVNDFWYLFLALGNDTLELYFSKNLLDGWKEHPKSPIIVNNSSNARPAGMPMRVGTKLFRFAQDCRSRYGGAVRAFEIIQIDPENYTEQEIFNNPILTSSGKGWNGLGMHHLSFIGENDGGFLAVTDGNRKLEQPIIFFLSYKLRISNFVHEKIMQIKKKGS